MLQHSWIMALVLYAGAINAQSCDSLVAIGDSLFDAFENRAALDAYTDAHRQCPERYEPFMKQVRALIDVGEEAPQDQRRRWFDEALKRTDALKQMAPDSLQSWFLAAAASGNLAQIVGGRTRVQVSRLVVDNAERAIAIDSTYDPSFVILGTYYREVATASDFLKFLAELVFGGVPEGSLEDSRRVLQQALRLNPRNMYAHLEMARTNLAMGNQQQAIPHLEKVLSLPVTNHYHPELKDQAKAILQNLNR
jgi:tetratricopeptide (TPR) repeat protein